MRMVRGARNGVGEKIQGILDENKRLHKDLEKLKNKLANAAGHDLMSGLRTASNVSILATIVDGADAKSLRRVADQVRSKMKSGVFLLAALEGEKAALIAGVTSDLTDKIKAGDLLKFVTTQVDGKGGGRADMAQGAAGDITYLPSALESVYGWVEKNLT
jgi:alanyl-tRNA synthetase